MISREIQTRKDNNRAIQINKEIQRTKMIIRESVNVQNETTQWLLFNPTITYDLFSWLNSILLNDYIQSYIQYDKKMPLILHKNATRENIH